MSTSAKLLLLLHFLVHMFLGHFESYMFYVTFLNGMSDCQLM